MNRKFYLIIVFLFLIVSKVFSSEIPIDKRVHEIDLLLKEADNLKYEDNDKGLEKVKEAEKLALQLSSKRKLGEVYTMLGIYYYTRGSYDVSLQMYLKDNGNPGLISGYTQDQRFFMSWATVWRSKATDAHLVNQVKTDSHSPGFYRSFAPLLNIDAFHKAFDTKPGDKLYKAPEERIRIW